MHVALLIATRNGAQALGIDHRIDFIEQNESADLTEVNLADSGELTPCYDPASHPVYAAAREHVTHVWVQGEEVVTNSHLNEIDRRQLLAKARSWQRQIKATEQISSTQALLCR